MEIFFNDCSLHGQFGDIQEFSDALDLLMGMRAAVARYGRELYCHRNFSLSAVTHDTSLGQAVQKLDKNKARSLMAWLCKSGPFWEDRRCHSQDDYLECRGNIVTDTAIGECAFLEISNRQAQLASISPSEWDVSPVDVDWHKDDGNVCSKSLVNHFSVETLEAELRSADPPPKSWAHLAEICQARFGDITFSDDAFEPLVGRPFVLSAAKGIIDLLDVLSRFKAEHQEGDRRTGEGNELYQQFFTGDGAWFSDSSSREKIDFKNDLTFTNPDDPGEKIFAPFHGKVQTPQMRVHFSWPIRSGVPLYVVYIGDKITKC